MANGLSEGVSQACVDDLAAFEVWERSDIDRVSFDELWHDGVDLCAIVQESHTALPIDSYTLAMFSSIPYQSG